MIKVGYFNFLGDTPKLKVIAAEQQTTQFVQASK
jgi:hypothetical protein